MTGGAPVLSFDAGSSKTSSSKAAASEYAKRTLHTRLPKQSEQLNPGRYVEHMSETRTKPGEKCILAHWSWAGGIKPFFTILPAR
jgi:hypothetical protein